MKTEVEIKWRKVGAVTIRVVDGVQGPEVRVTAPYGIDKDALNELLVAKAGWLSRSIEKKKASSAKTNRYALLDSVPVVIEHEGAFLPVIVERSQRDSVAISEGRLVIGVKDPGDTKAVLRGIDRWTIRETIRAAEEASRRLMPMLEGAVFEKPDISTRFMRSRWGSCNKLNGRISINASLLKAPKELLSYVVAHELAHLVHPDHQEGFKRALSMLMPDWRRHKAELARWATGNVKSGSS